MFAKTICTDSPYRRTDVISLCVSPVLSRASRVLTGMAQIEWVKGLLAVPFVLLSQPTAAIHDGQTSIIAEMAQKAHRRYAQILQDVQDLVDDHRACTASGTPNSSKLKMLVPSIGTFFTPLPLRDAFVWQDERRSISSRRFVAPSFNDVRLILNTAQAMSLTRTSKLELVTFDGDVTLYDDGQSLTDDSPAIPRILHLMRQGVRIGIVTAAGYVQAEGYYARLHGLLNAIAASDLPQSYKSNLIIMGGESSYLFQFDSESPHKLKNIERRDWILEEMHAWTAESITELLDVAEKCLQNCIDSMRLQAQIIRKERAVGIVPLPGTKLSREQLEETVLVCQRGLETSPAGSRLPFCAFNGGSDVFIDIGTKQWGVLACQKYFGGVDGSRTLHIGDQFLSIGANDFKVKAHCLSYYIKLTAGTGEAGVHHRVDSESD